MSEDFDNENTFEVHGCTLRMFVNHILNKLIDK